MKTTLEKVRRGIAAALLGRTPGQLADEQRQAAVKTAVDEYLIRNPDWKASQQPAPAVVPIRDSKIKMRRILKTLGQNGFTPHVIDEGALARARAKCREIVTADPAAYSYIIESAPIKGMND